MTDYMSEASKAVYMCTTRGGMSEREAMMQTLAKHLEALDTANTRADAAEKRERELRDAAAKAAKRALAVFDANDLAEPGPRGLLNALIQPEPDPLVEAVKDCGYATLDYIEPEFAADLRTALAKYGLSIVKGESL